MFGAGVGVVDPVLGDITSQVISYLSTFSIFYCCVDCVRNCAGRSKRAKPRSLIFWFVGILMDA